MQIVEHMLILIVLVTAFNIILSAIFWLRNRSVHNLTLLLIWVSAMISFGFQGAVINSLTLSILALGTAVFINNLCLSYLLVNLASLRFPKYFYIGSVCTGFLFFGISFLMKLPFVFQAFPVALGASMPLMMTAYYAVKTKWKSLSFSGKSLTIIIICYFFHTLDYPFLRNTQIGAIFGFAVAFGLIYAISIFGPAVILEATERQKSISDAEIAEAQKLQRKLIPTKPAFQHLDLDFKFEPSSKVGGDFLSFETLPDSKGLRILLGDVTGHGMEAALGAFISTTILTVERLRTNLSVKALCDQLNKTLVYLNDVHNAKIGLTFVAMDINLENKLTFFGSHDPLLLFRAQSQTFETVTINSFPFRLGVDEFDLSGQEPQSLQLDKNDVLFLYTDGLTEGRKYAKSASKSEYFGLARIQTIIKSGCHKRADEISNAIQIAFDEWTEKKYDDDVCFIVVKV